MTVENGGQKLASGPCHLQPEPVARGPFSRPSDISSDRSGPLPPARNAPVAQLDRASDYESEGRTFESFRARQKIFKHFQCIRSAWGLFQAPISCCMCCRMVACVIN